MVIDSRNKVDRRPARARVVCAIMLLAAFFCGWPRPGPAQTLDVLVLNHGLVAAGARSSLDPVFRELYAAKRAELNRWFDTLLIKRCAERWPLLRSREGGEDLDPARVVQLMVIVSRAGVNEESFKLSTGGSLTFNTFTVGLSAVFFKMTGEGDDQAVQLYYNRLLTAEKQVRSEGRLSAAGTRAAFDQTLSEALEKLVDTAYADYNPLGLTGAVTGVRGKAVNVALSLRQGLNVGDILAADLGHGAEESYRITAIGVGDCWAEPFFGAAGEKTPRRMTAVVNAKRIRHSQETFGLNPEKFSIKPEAKAFAADREALAQLFHDYLAQTGRVNLLPSAATLSPEARDALVTALNLPLSTEVLLPRPTYLVSTVIQKVVKKSLRKGEINEAGGYMAFAAAGVRAADDPEKLLAMAEAAQTKTVNIIAGQTVTDREHAYDALQLALRELAQELAKRIEAGVPMHPGY
jgi:hypothetical protein